jgi:hypothetical protein
MRAYCGQTRSSKLVELLKRHGIGECTVRGELFSRKRDPWFYDNGAFRDWQAEKPFNSMRFTRDMRRIRIDREFGNGHGSPDFVVAPDMVAAGMTSLEFSCAWRHDLEGLPCYLAVQDGMTPARVGAALRTEELMGDDAQRFVGIFIGGSLPWKLDTAAEWVRFAHDTGRRCHIGRVGPPDRVRWARDAGADSIDSCLPLMHAEHMDAFLSALTE